MAIKILITGIAYDILNSLAIVWTNYLMRNYNAELLRDSVPIYFQSIFKIIRGEFMQSTLILRIKVKKKELYLITREPSDVDKKSLKKADIIVLLVDGDEEDAEFTIKLSKMLGRKRRKKFVIALCENKNFLGKVLERVFPNNKMLDYPHEILNLSFETIEKFKNVKKLSEAVDLILSKKRFVDESN